jgi:hypothetical protein
MHVSPQRSRLRTRAQQFASITRREPVFIGGAPNESASSTAIEDRILTPASREAARRDEALLRGLNRADARMVIREPELRQPVLGKEFFARIEALDHEIVERGVAIDRDRLVSLGRERFDELLTCDRGARTWQRIIGTRRDLTSWASVFHALAENGAMRQIPVPERKSYEQLYGINKEIDLVRQVSGFLDLWKLSCAQPQAIRAINAFRDVFKKLVFAQSMLERLSDDGRLRSRFFSGGTGARVDRFLDWRDALDGTHFVIRIENQLQAVIFWLTGETSEAPDVLDLARECFNVRAPSASQIKFAQAVFDGFLLNHKDWNLWQSVGRATQTLPDNRLLNVCCDRFKERFQRIRLFHHEVQRCFFRTVGNHNELDSTAWRRFIDRSVNGLRARVSALAALAVSEHLPSAVVARFQDSLLCESEPSAQLVEIITEKLEAAFDRTAFKVEIE